MSHNPNTVKSQDDTAEDELGRTMTLLRVIEQLDKTVCKLEKTKKQLDIAVKALEEYADENYYLFPTYRNGHERAEVALKEIKELNK